MIVTISCFVLMLLCILFSFPFFFFFFFFFFICGSKRKNRMVRVSEIHVAECIRVNALQCLTFNANITSVQLYKTCEVVAKRFVKFSKLLHAIPCQILSKKRCEEHLYKSSSHFFGRSYQSIDLMHTIKFND